MCFHVFFFQKNCRHKKKNITKKRFPPGTTNQVLKNMYYFTNLQEDLVKTSKQVLFYNFLLMYAKTGTVLRFLEMCTTKQVLLIKNARKLLWIRYYFRRFWVNAITTKRVIFHECEKNRNYFFLHICCLHGLTNVGFSWSTSRPGKKKYIEIQSLPF